MHTRDGRERTLVYLCAAGCMRVSAFGIGWDTMPHSGNGGPPRRRRPWQQSQPPPQIPVEAHLVHLKRLALLYRLQVDGKRRHPQHRPMDSEQSLVERPVLRTHNHAPRNREVAVEPRVPETAAVALDVDLGAVRPAKTEGGKGRSKACMRRVA